MEKHAVSPILIDCQYVHPQYAGAYLIKDGDRALFVENNTAHAVPILLHELKKQGLSPDQVNYLIITHVHLDHAGGTSALLEACPRASLLGHPRAVRHIVDPSKLVSSARQVYGDALFEKLYGEIKPVADQRVRALSDGEEIRWGSRQLKFFYTRGHANHHLCVFDSSSNGVFTGDAFGLAYPALQRNGLFIFPSTSPTDFDPNEAKRSIEAIVGTGAQQAFLTHFGRIKKMREAADQLLKGLEFHEKLLNQTLDKSWSKAEAESFCKKELNQYFSRELEARGLGSDSAAWEVLRPDLELNAAGIVVAAERLKHRTG